MTDITDRLRSRYGATFLDEAAAREIEVLRAERDRAVAACEQLGRRVADLAPESQKAMQAVEDALGRILYLIDAAGLDNLANGVQLGPTSWYVKMSEAVQHAKSLLPPAPNND